MASCSERWNLRWSLIVVATAIHLVASALVGQGPKPPIINVEGEFINFESPLIKPILVTADGQHLVALNEPDNRVVVRDRQTLAITHEIVAGQGLVALAERPGAGEIWVSAMHSAAVLVIDTDTWQVTHALHPAPDPKGVTGDGASPGGIAFSADGSKAWVVATATDALLVYHAVNKVHLKTVPLGIEHNGLFTRMKEPRAIVRSGDTVYVAIFRSGNNSAAIPYRVIGVSPVIMDLNKTDGWSLPDADILAISAIDDSIIFHQKAVGTLGYGLDVHPQTGDLLITHMDAENTEYLGERAFPMGRTTLNKLTYITPGEAPQDYQHVALEDLPGPGGTASLAMPTDIAVDASGRVFVAAYASSQIGVFDAAGGWLGLLPSDAGPRGLATSPDGQRLYSLNRIAGTITAYDISSGLPTGPFASQAIGLYDPTFDRARLGRALYNDASNSGGGSTGCFSCHPDLTQDGVAWELSKYHDAGEGFGPGNEAQFWQDIKFARTTQDCRSIEESAPYHWRGEQSDLEAFNGAFADLTKGERLSDSDFSLVKDYIFGAVYPSNPFQLTDREPSLSAQKGWVVSQTSGACRDCHTPPFGTRGAINGSFGWGRHAFAGNELRAAEAASWRGLFTKEADTANIRDGVGPVLPQAVTGFGYDHSGAQFNLANYVSNQGGRLESLRDPAHSGVGPLDQEDKLNVFHYAREFDSGLAPASNLAYTLNAQSWEAFPGGFLAQQAAANNCDVAVRGRIKMQDAWRDVGLFYDRELGIFVPDRDSVPALTPADLVQLAQQGKADLLVLGVPVGSGKRMGVDRDRDGVYDGNEAVLGTDPVNPDSDGDGFWDSYDDDPLVPNPAVSNIDPPQVVSHEIQAFNSRSARLVYETDTFSPTRVVYGTTTDYGQVVGDPWPLPEGSNHWKRSHAIVLRNMEPGSVYHFQIITRGQNGAEGASIDDSFETESRLLVQLPWTDDGIFTEDLTVSVERPGGVTTVIATISVTSDKSDRVANAEVRGIWTLFRDGDPFVQFMADVSVTDAGGVAVVSLTDSRLQTGDEVDFTIPTHHEIGDEDIPGIRDDQATRRVFSWPDNAVSSVRIAIP